MRTIVTAILLAAAAAFATGAPTLMNDQQNKLTAIDTVPTRDQLNQAFDNNAQQALTQLASIATTPDTTLDPQNGIDPGIKLRAIHALAKYCGDPPATPCTSGELAHQSVTSVITSTRSIQAGTQVLMLRAAIETLGTMKVATDEPLLRPLLDHPSRDIRAATARALRDLCNPQAITPLRARYSNEMTDQVKLAISEALRILGQCATNP